MIKVLFGNDPLTTILGAVGALALYFSTVDASQGSLWPILGSVGVLLLGRFTNRHPAPPK